MLTRKSIGVQLLREMGRQRVGQHRGVLELRERQIYAAQQALRRAGDPVALANIERELDEVEG